MKKSKNKVQDTDLNLQLDSCPNNFPQKPKPTIQSPRVSIVSQRRFTLTDSKPLAQNETNKQQSVTSSRTSQQRKASKVLSKNEINFNDYIRTVDQKGRVVYQSKNTITLPSEKAQEVVQNSDNDRFVPKQNVIIRSPQRNSRQLGQITNSSKGINLITPIKKIDEPLKAQNTSKQNNPKTQAQQPTDQTNNRTSYLSNDQVVIRRTSSRITTEHSQKVLNDNQKIIQAIDCSPTVQARQIYSPNQRRFSRQVASSSNKQLDDIKKEIKNNGIPTTIKRSSFYVGTSPRETQVYNHS